MADFGGYRDVLAKIRDEWNKAEEDVKRAEQVNSKAVIPAIKELRYAGRRLVDILIAIENNGTKKEIDDFLADALFDCYRARHDAIDAATAQMAIDLKLMRDHLGLEIVLRAYPKFPDFWRQLLAVRRKIAQSRGNRADREKIYSIIETTDFPDLVLHHENLQASEGIMREMAGKRRRRFALAIGIGVIGALLAAADILIHLLVR